MKKKKKVPLLPLAIQGIGFSATFLILIIIKTIKSNSLSVFLDINNYFNSDTLFSFVSALVGFMTLRLTSTNRKRVLLIIVSAIVGAFSLIPYTISELNIVEIDISRVKIDEKAVTSGSIFQVNQIGNINLYIFAFCFLCILMIALEALFMVVDIKTRK